jgi:hypothetical protein
MTSTRRFAAAAASGAVAMLVGGALASPALADAGDHDPNSHAAVTATAHADENGSADQSTHENEAAATETEHADASPHTNESDSPPGANGTVKIELASGPVTHANHPHPGCTFRVALFNFDTDSTVHLSFTGQAPTRTSGTFTPAPLTYTSDPTVSPVYDLSSLFSGVTPKKQGFHVKLTATQDGAPGAGKHTVFWVNCGELAAPAHAGPARPETGSATGGAAGTEAASATSNGGSGSGTSVLGTSAVAGTQVLGSSAAAGSLLASGASPSAPATSASGTQVLGLEATRASSTAAATTKPAAVAPASAVRGRALARTGLDVGLLLLLAAGAVVLGGFGRASASRRRVG